MDSLSICILLKTKNISSLYRKKPKHMLPARKLACPDQAGQFLWLLRIGYSLSITVPLRLMWARTALPFEPT